nr:transcriptional activator protein [African cassava mosaic virus]
MQSSSPSQNHSTQVPIKVSHRHFKKRAIRRKESGSCLWLFILPPYQLLQSWIYAQGNSSLLLKQ